MSAWICVEKCEKMDDKMDEKMVESEEKIDKNALAVNDPERFRTLKNGAIYDMKTKRIVSAPPNDRQFITRENARELSLHRWRMVREAAEEGLMRIKPGVKSHYDAFSEIVYKQGMLALDIKRGRDSTEAARFVRDSTGLGPPKQGIVQDMPQSGVQLLISSEIAERIVKTLANLPNQS